MSENIERALGRIEGKIDALVAQKTDHETRIRSLEKRSWLIAGGAAVIAFITERIVK